MLAICPKHKGTERVQEEIKKKIAKLKRVQPKKVKREEIYFVKKEGGRPGFDFGTPKFWENFTSQFTLQYKF